MKIKSILLTTALLLTTHTFAQKIETKLPAPAKALETKDQAPDFSLKGQNGKTYSLKDYKGKVVVLEWFNTDCPFVKKHYETDNMQKLQQKYTSQGAVWFSISSTNPDQALKQEEASKIYSGRKSKATALLLDSNGDMARTYGAKTTPHMFIIGADGKIAYTGAIDDNDSFSKDAVKGAKNYVSDALEVLLSKDKTKSISVSQTKPYGCSIKIGS